TDASLMMAVIGAVIAVLVFASSALGYGMLVVRCVKDVPKPLSHPSVEYMLGAGVIGTALFVVGQWQLNRLVIVATLLPGLVVVTRACLFARRKDLKRLLRKHSLVCFRRYWGALSAPLVLAMLFLAASYPLIGGFYNDGVTYHVLGPSRWLAVGHIFPLPEAARTAFPAIAETDFAVVLGLSNTSAVRLLEVLFVWAMFAFIPVFTRLAGGSSRAASIALALTASSPALLVHVGRASNDIPMAVFCLMAASIFFLPVKRGACIIA